MPQTANPTKKPLNVPEELDRNSAQVRAQGAENTGEAIISLVAETLGRADLGDRHVLDVGCGVRFTQAIINREIPIGSYTGVDVCKPLIDYLQAEVTDPRFTFAWWDVHNDQYNPHGRPMPDHESLPVTGPFDIICLFSVFTHLFPDDSFLLLKMMRKVVDDDGALVFTTFIVDDVDEFENRAALPEIYACYGEAYMRSLLEAAGWRVQSLQPPNMARYVQHMFVCCPG
jgi:SAM-dependent methyltransferase